MNQDAHRLESLHLVAGVDYPNVKLRHRKGCCRPIHDAYSQLQDLTSTKSLPYTSDLPLSLVPREKSRCRREQRIESLQRHPSPLECHFHRGSPVGRH